MPRITRMCQIASCNREAATLCYHCQQEVCRTHFNQHTSIITADICSLADQIDALTNNNTTFSIARTDDNLFNQSPKWRDDSINLIENIYRRKQIELDAKIRQLGTLLRTVKAEKQQEMSEIMKEMNKLIDASEAIFDQMKRLRESVDRSVFYMDKLRTPTIQIESRPAYTDTCQIVSMSQVPYTHLEDVAVSNVHANDDIRYFNRPTDEFHFSTSQSMVLIENSRSHSSSPVSSAVTNPYPLYTTHSFSTLPSFLSSPSMLPYSIQSKTSIPHSSIFKSSELFYPQRPLSTPSTHLTYESSPYTFMKEYLPLESSYSTLWSPDFSAMNQLPVYTR